jgi:hypothetical protein
MKQLLSVLTLSIFAVLFYASASPEYLRYVENTYAEQEERIESKDTTIIYQNPVISLEDGTKQTQKQGGVTITCEAVPISINKIDKSSEVYLYRDPARANMDIKKVAHKPEYSLNPNEIQLKVTINNNQGRVLKLRDCAIVMIVDNLQYSLPQDVVTIWEGSNVISGFSTSLILKGPQLQTLTRPKSIEVFINDVPTLFDQAGNVLRRDNFTWLFTCRLEPKTVEDKITYTYEETPIRIERCNVCQAVGYIESKQVCTKCGGDGKFIGAIDKKEYKCDRCEATGKETVKTTCTTCSGDGKIDYPKSKLPPITSTVEWTGFKVDVISTPPGATVSVFDRKTKKYIDVGTTPKIDIVWLNTQSKVNPIIIKYNNETVKVLPYTESNKAVTRISVDFSTGTGVVKTGTKVD